MWAARHGHLSMVENGLNLLQARWDPSASMPWGWVILGSSVWVPGFGPMTIGVLTKMGMDMVIDGDWW